MIRLLLLVQLLFARPQPFASASNVQHDVVVVITYSTPRPVRACTQIYAPDDTDLLQPLLEHCWTPTNDVGDIDRWPDASLQTLGSILCVITQPDGTKSSMLLAYWNS